MASEQQVGSVMGNDYKSDFMVQATAIEEKRQLTGRDTGECDFPIFENFLAVQREYNSVVISGKVVRLTDEERKNPAESWRRIFKENQMNLRVVESAPNEVFIDYDTWKTKKSLQAVLHDIWLKFRDVQKRITVDVTHSKTPGNYHIRLGLPWVMTQKNKALVAMACGSDLAREWIKLTEAQRGQTQNDLFFETDLYRSFRYTGINCMKELNEWKLEGKDPGALKAKAAVEERDRLLEEGSCGGETGIVYRHKSKRAQEEERQNSENAVQF